MAEESEEGSRSRSPHRDVGRRIVHVRNVLTGRAVCTIVSRPHWTAQSVKICICRRLGWRFVGVQIFIDCNQLEDGVTLSSLKPGEPRLTLDVCQGDFDIVNGGQWKRMESLRYRGVYYYWHTDTWDTQLHPPAPWFKVVRGCCQIPGTTVYRNLVTNEMLDTPPEHPPGSCCYYNYEYGVWSQEPPDLDVAWAIQPDLSQRLRSLLLCAAASLRR